MKKYPFPIHAHRIIKKIYGDILLENDKNQFSYRGIVISNGEVHHEKRIPYNSRISYGQIIIKAPTKRTKFLIFVDQYFIMIIDFFKNIIHKIRK